MGRRAEHIRRQLLINAVQDCLDLNELISDEIEKLGDARDQLIERAEQLLKKFNEPYPPATGG